MMDSLSWQAVPLHTWGFPAMSNFTHGQLELLLAFNKGPALYPLYNLWPSFVLPRAQPLFKISIFLLFPFIIIPEYLFVFILFSFPHRPFRLFPFLFILAIILEMLFHAPSFSVSPFSHSLLPEQDLLKFRPAERFLCTGCVITKAGSPTNKGSSGSQW